MIRPNRSLLAAVALACVSAWAPQSTAFAQVPAASEPAGGAPRAYSAAELETLVGPFALYPDDLVAIILPASTYPLQIVQADRFLDKRKANPKLQIDEGWDDSVKALVNYPDVVKKMSGDLDWTEALGEAVVSNNSAVMDAVQAFRRKAQSAGNLKSDDKQKIVVEQQIVRIEQADPQVIYVPQYQPSTVIVAGAPPYPYYPTPYPAYYYPYPPGAALATGLIWGAAIGAAWNGGRYGANYGGGSVNINNSNNITIDRGNTNVGSGNRGNRPSQQPSNAWKPTKQPGQVGGAAGNRPAGGNRVGDPGRGGGGMGGAGSARPSQGDRGGRGGGPSASTRPAGGDAGRGGGAFGGMDSGAGAHRASARGAESRGSYGGGGMQARPGGGGGSQFAGGRPAGGGGGARMGGGGGGGGARAGGGGGGGRGGGGGGGRGGGGRGR